MKGSGHGADSRSMQEGRQRGAVLCDKFLEQLGAAGAQSFFQEGCPENRLTFQLHQQPQTRLSMGAGRLELPSTYARRMPASSVRGVGVLPRVLADFTGPLGYLLNREVPESSIIAQLGGRVREVRDTPRQSRKKRWQALSPNLSWNGVSVQRGGGPKTPRDRHAGCARRGHHGLTQFPMDVGRAGQPAPSHRAHSFSGPAAYDGTPAGTG